MSVYPQPLDGAQYANRLSGGDPALRYWLCDDLLVSGSILDAEDGRQLREQLGVTHVVNLQTGQSDVGKGFDDGTLLEKPFQDNGTSGLRWLMMDVLPFARRARVAGGKLCVHCREARSRAPSVAYGVARAIHRMTPGQIVQAIRRHCPDYGRGGYHQIYLSSIESFAGSWRG